jgi:trigger factor
VRNILNIQTERLENHTARLTVELTVDDLEKAKKQAATKLSNQYNIPGFRKGKAPYNVVSKFLGEATILETAIETLGNSVYPKALDESKILPYAAGNMEDFKLDPVPTYVFTLPLQPEVELGDYHSVRVAFEQPAINEDALERTLEMLRQQSAETQDVEGEIEAGHRITVDVHSHFEDGEEHDHDDDEDDDEHDHDDDEDDDDEHDHDDDEDDDEEHDHHGAHKGDDFFHRHDAVLNLNPENEPVMKGFISQIVGAKVGDSLEFELTVAEDDEANKEHVGRVISFYVDIKKAESVTLPTLDDEFAAKLTAQEEEPLNLEQLKVRVSENLQREAENEYNSKYGELVLDEVVAISKASFPEVMVTERAKEMVNSFAERLKQQRISFDMYKSITGMGEEQLMVQYRDEAEKFVRRSLVLGEMLLKENIELTQGEINDEIAMLAAQYGDDARFRQFLNAREQQVDIANRMLYSKLMERLVTIGKGEYNENKEGVAEDEAEIVDSATPATVADND